MPQTNTVRKNTIILIILSAFFTSFSTVYGRNSSDYATHSVLADGKWVKIATTQAGIYQIPYDSLSAWGFTDPSNVKLFGYGGLVIDELFSNQDGYIDDLPQIPLWQHNNTLYFYSTGTTRWTFDSNNNEFAQRTHPYSTQAYYFLTDKAVTKADFATLTSPTPANPTPVSTFNDYALHEQELVSVGETGQNFFGEDFLATPNQDFEFHLPGAQPAPIKIRVSFGAKIEDGEGYIYISYNGSELPTSTTNRISKYYDSYEFLRQVSPLKTYNQASEESTISLRYTSTGSTLCAYLDYIRLNYQRLLQLYDGQVAFRFINRTSNDRYQIGNSTASTVVWDITTPHAPKVVSTTFENQTTCFSPIDTQLREYIAFDPAQKFPSPSFVKRVGNQNLHALDIADLTIITPAALQSEAERVAQLHQEEGLSVIVVEQEQIFNEFSSGTPDATAYRRLMKMFYDRATNEADRPRYLLLFGDGSYDNRASMKNLHTPQCSQLLTYQSKTSIDERESFVLEDYFGFLEEGSGQEIKTDKVCLGIGRYPVSSLQNARLAVDKLYRYVQNSALSPWKNNICIAADDGDEAVHTKQADLGSDTLLLKNSDNPKLGYRVNKIYIDSYYLDPKEKKYLDAHRELMKYFDEGMLLFDFIGHNASEIGFTGEGLFPRLAMDSLDNSRLPFVITITCDYCRFDDGSLTAGEGMFLNPTAGAIGLITTTRVVYTDGNDKINRRLMKWFLSRDDNGEYLRIGDIMMRAKRDFNTEIDKNKLNYVLIGDPALRLAYPQYNLQVTRINGQSATSQTEMESGQSYTVEGEVRTPQGELLSDFNGEVYFSLYDEEKSFTTLAHQDAKTWTYNYRPDLLTTGIGTVQNGRFSLTVVLPPDNSHSGKSALLNLYACEPSGREANGYTEQLIIGTAPATESTDTQGPEITFAGIDSDHFTDGARIETPASFICRFSDPSGIWSGNTLGRQMILLLNGATIEDNPSRYYRPTLDGNTPGGELVYPIPALREGLYTLTFKVFDTLGNSSEVTTAFEIAPDESDYRLRLDEEPVIEQATFTCQDLEGNALGEVKRARISVTDMRGEEVWYRETSGNPFPLVWDLLDNNGLRVPAGQYDCRAYLETETGSTATPTKKIVVITQ